jgi:hypothetical protein
VSCTCEICATKPSHSLRLSPTTIGKSIFASPDATIHEGITSNRRGKAHDIFAIEERGDAHLQSLSPRMQTTGAGPASRRRRSRWGATIRARRSSRDCRRRESRGGADAPGRRRRGSRGGADEDGPRWCAGARLLPRRACGFFPGESSNFFPHGRSDFFFVRPGDRSSRRRISSESTGDVGGGIDVEREGRRSFGSEGRSSGEERSRGERPPAHGREQRSPTGQEVAAAQGKAATPRLFPFACWRRHLLPSLVCTVETMQTSFCLSDLQHLVGLSLRL